MAGRGLQHDCRMQCYCWAAASRPAMLCLTLTPYPPCECSALDPNPPDSAHPPLASCRMGGCVGPVALAAALLVYSPPLGPAEGPRPPRLCRQGLCASSSHQHMSTSQSTSQSVCQLNSGSMASTCSPCFMVTVIGCCRTSLFAARQPHRRARSLIAYEKRQGNP